MLVLLVNNAQVYLPQQWWCEKNTCFGSCVSINAITYSVSKLSQKLLNVFIFPPVTLLEMKICTSITGWGDQTIRDSIQFATFSTNVRHVLCDLCENETWLAQFKNCNNFVLRSITLPKCQCTAEQYHLFDICCLWCVMSTPFTGV